MNFPPFFIFVRSHSICRVCILYLHRPLSVVYNTINSNLASYYYYYIINIIIIRNQVTTSTFNLNERKNSCSHYLLLTSGSGSGLRSLGPVTPQVVLRRTLFFYFRLNFLIHIFSILTERSQVLSGFLFLEIIIMKLKKRGEKQKKNHNNNNNNTKPVHMSVEHDFLVLDKFDAEFFVLFWSCLFLFIIIMVNRLT